MNDNSQIHINNFNKSNILSDYLNKMKSDEMLLSPQVSQVITSDDNRKFKRPLSPPEKNAVSNKIRSPKIIYNKQKNESASFLSIGFESIEEDNDLQELSKTRKYGIKRNVKSKSPSPVSISIPISASSSDKNVRYETQASDQGIKLNNKNKVLNNTVKNNKNIRKIPSPNNFSKLLEENTTKYYNKSFKANEYEKKGSKEINASKVLNSINSNSNIKSNNQTYNRSKAYANTIRRGSSNNVNISSLNGGVNGNSHTNLNSSNIRIPNTEINIIENTNNVEKTLHKRNYKLEDKGRLSSPMSSIARPTQTVICKPCKELSKKIELLEKSIADKDVSIKELDNKVKAFMTVNMAQADEINNMKNQLELKNKEIMNLNKMIENKNSYRSLNKEDNQQEIHKLRMFKDNIIEVSKNYDDINLNLTENFSEIKNAFLSLKTLLSSMNTKNSSKNDFNKNLCSFQLETLSNQYNELENIINRTIKLKHNEYLVLLGNTINPINFQINNDLDFDDNDIITRPIKSDLNTKITNNSSHNKNQLTHRQVNPNQRSSSNDIPNINISNNIASAYFQNVLSSTNEKIDKTHYNTNLSNIPVNDNFNSIVDGNNTSNPKENEYRIDYISHNVHCLKSTTSNFLNTVLSGPQIKYMNTEENKKTEKNIINLNNNKAKSTNKSKIKQIKKNK